MAPPCDQRNDGSLRAYLHRPAPRGTPVVAATASDQATDRDNRADAKLQLLALRRQNKKDKEKARKERRKQQVTPATTATAAAAAAAAVPGAAVAVAVESQGKQTATGAAGAGAIGQVAVAVAVVATAVVVESVESAEQPAASGGSGAPEGSTQSCKSAEAAGPRQSPEAPESKEAPKSQQSEEEPEEVAQVRQTGESTEPVKLGKSGESSSSSTEESGKSAHQSRQSGAELGQSGKSPAGVKEEKGTESSRQLAIDVDVAAVEVGVAAAGKAELSAPPPPLSSSSSSAAAAASSSLLSPSSVTSTTVGGDNTCEPVLARQRLQEPLLPMLNKKKNDDDDNSQVTDIKKVATTHVAAEAAEAAQGATVPATASTTAAAVSAAAAAAAAVQAAKEAGEKAEEHALLDKRELNMSTGVVRDQAQEEQETTDKSKNRPVLRLPPARKHAAEPLKSFASPTEAPELLLPAARDLWTGRCQSSRGGLKKGDLHPLVLEAIRGHPDLFELSPDELSVYVDTVLAIVFYWYSRCGVVRLCDLRSGGFIQELDAVCRLEMGLEESEYFSLARHKVMRTEFFRLCDGGWSVGHEALRWYRHYGDGSVVGAVRARRVIDAGLRPFPREKPTGSGMSGVGGYGDELEYDGWVCFFLCEEALQNGTWSERDVRYCFHLVDETGRGRVGMTEVTRFFEDMQWDSVISGYSEDAYWPSVQEVISHHLDSMAVEKRRDYITLKEMTRSDYTVDRAGNFFEELFAGTAPPENGYSNGEDEYEDNDYEGTGGGQDGNSETTGEGQSSHSTGGEGGGEAEGMGKGETFEGTGEEVGGNDSGGTRQEGQQCQPPPPPPPPPVAASAVPAAATPCPMPMQTVPMTAPYLQNVGGTFYPAQGPPLEQHGHQSWAPQQANIAGGYPISPSASPPPPPPPPPPLCAQAQAVAYGNHVEAACPIPSSPGMQQQPLPQTGVVYSGNIGGTCYPVQAPPVEQQASSAYYAGNVAGNTRCSPSPLYPQPHTSAYGGTVAGVSCPTQAGYMQPQGLAYGGHAAGIYPMQQTGYMQPQQPGAYGERFEGMRPVGMGYMQPHPLAYGGNLGGMCPMPPVSTPQYPPPVAYGGNPYPMQMPQW